MNVKPTLYSPEAEYGEGLKGSSDINVYRCTKQMYRGY